MPGPSTQQDRLAVMPAALGRGGGRVVRQHPHMPPRSCLLLRRTRPCYQALLPTGTPETVADCMWACVPCRLPLNRKPLGFHVCKSVPPARGPTCASAPTCFGRRTSWSSPGSSPRAREEDAADQAWRCLPWVCTWSPSDGGGTPAQPAIYASSPALQVLVALASLCSCSQPAPCFLRPPPASQGPVRVAVSRGR